MFSAIVILTALVLSPSVLGSRVKRQYLNYDKTTNSCTTLPPDSRPGKCINVKLCPLMYNIMKTKRSDAVAMKYVLSSICAYQGKDPVVCCPEEINYKFPPNNICGKTDVKHDRVVGGQPAALGAWPWLAALGYTTPTKFTPEWRCGGSLINNQYVLTAAHCVVLLDTLTRRTLSFVRLGDLDLDDDAADGASPVNIKVNGTIVHPEYNSTRFYTDIALVRLATKVIFTNLIKPICMPLSADLKSSDFTGRTPFTAGWGSLSFKGPSTNIQQEVQIDVIDLPICIKAYRNIKNSLIDKRSICAGRTGKDACQGDSGGPLMMAQGENFYLIGIVSYGVKCAEPGYPGIYTRVTEFIDWIDKTVQIE